MAGDITPREVRERALYQYILNFAERFRVDATYEIKVDAAASADAIAELYYRYAEEIVRPAIDSGIIQNYKIIGYTELCVLRVNPIELVSGGTQIEMETVNAQLAFNIAIGMLIDWNMLDQDKFGVLISSDTQIRSFIKEHILWLSHLDSRYYFPGFSNAQVWKLFHYLVDDRIKHSPK